MASKNKTRIDELLVRRGLVDSLSIAKALVMEGKVLANDQRVDKPSDQVTENAQIRLKDQGRFVSRGGEKLAGALVDLRVEDLIKNATVLDVGASTGGFTDCCLSLGARQVIAVDVGVNQLAWKLRTDPRVVCLEKTDIRDFKPDMYPKIDWVVGDISFNSLGRLLPSIVNAAPEPGVSFLLLIKPQFELSAQELGSDFSGVVSDDNLRNKAVANVADAFSRLGFKDGLAVESQLEGQSGNREIFYYTKRILV